MPEFAGEITIHPARVLRDPSTDERLLTETANEVAQAQRQGFAELVWDELTERPPYLVAPDGSVWRRERGIPGGGRTTRDYRYAITRPVKGPLGIAWYRRCLHPEPESLAELDRREERNRKAAEAQRAELMPKREALRKNPPARTLTMGDAYSQLGKGSLREIARRLEAAGGVLMVERDGGLTIRVSIVDDNVVRLLVKHKPGPIDPEALPDAELTVGGSLLPPDLLGHGEIEKR